MITTASRRFDYPNRLDEVDWARLDMLNVQYIVTLADFNLYDYLPGEFAPAEPVYRDKAVSIWLNPTGAWLPRAYLMSANLSGLGDGKPPTLANTVGVSRDTGRELFLDFTVPDEAAYLVVSQTHMDGWRAFIPPTRRGLRTPTTTQSRPSDGEFHRRQTPHHG